MIRRYLSMVVWLWCCLPNAAQSQPQEQAVRLNDLNLMLGRQAYTRQAILDKMHTFHQVHTIALSVTLLSEQDVYQVFSLDEETRWLEQSSPDSIYLYQKENIYLQRQSNHFGRRS